MHFPPKGIHFQEKGMYFPPKGIHFQEKGKHFPPKGIHFQEKCMHFKQKCIHFQEKGKHFPPKGIYFQEKGKHFPPKGIHFQEKCMHFKQKCIHLREKCINFSKKCIHFKEKCIHFLKRVYTFGQKCIHFLKKCIHFWPKVYTLWAKSVYTFGQKCIHFLKSVYTFGQKCIHFCKSVYTFPFCVYTSTHRKCLELCMNKMRHMYSWLETWLKSLTGHSCVGKMHYFQLPVKTQPNGPTPSDTDLRSFATEYFASYFRDEDVPREARLPKVRELESEFFAVSGRALWKLVLKRVEELADDEHFAAAFYKSYKVDILDEFLRRHGDVVYLEEWLEASRRDYGDFF